MSVDDLSSLFDLSRHHQATDTRNVLDSSAPTVRRGKEREVPKKKKPSSIRKVTRQ